MSVEGLEPPTNGLKGHCSTIELHALLRFGFYHAQQCKSTEVREVLGGATEDRMLAPIATEDGEGLGAPDGRRRTEDERPGIGDGEKEIEEK